MWSNISAPKSGLKAAQVGQQVHNSNQNATTNSSTNIDQEQENKDGRQFWSPRRVSGHSPSGQSPLMRYKHAVCSAPSTGHIYIHGGRFANGVPLDDDLWRFDPHENSWTQLKTAGSKPPSLQEHTLVEHEGKLYLFGGQVSAASGQENFFWRLDLTSSEWTSLNMKSSMKRGAYLGPTNRRGHSACLYRGSLYIFGGFEDFRGSTNQLWQYDLANERWELRNLSASSACHPEPRHNHSAVVYQDSMYIYGGLSNLKPLADLWRWSWRDKRWSRERTRGHGPGSLHGHSAIQAFGSMFVFGGERQNGRTTRSLWRLDLSNLCWHKIKPKGPRPNPTTWHGAIANPLSVLDEANYLIEAESSDIELEHQNHHDELMLINLGHHHHHQQQQSMSDNSFSTATSQQQQQCTVPIECIRPPANGKSHPKVSSSKVTKSSSEQQMASGTSSLVGTSNGQSRLATKSKRRLKLSFLRRGRKQHRSGQAEAKPIPTSWSAASILNGSATASTKNLQPLKKRHSVQISDTSRDNDVEMADTTQVKREHEPAGTNVAILDSLDSDIKQMFEHAMSPGDERPTKTQIVGLNRDSLTQSQLSSYLAGATSTQTYQTAREQMTSQSTLVSSGDKALQADHHQQEQPQQNKLADIRQRSSTQQVNSTSAKSGRPKSEIVQSLIDRADARIKHLYTPYFNPDQQLQQGQRNSTGSREDPLLGKLAQHPMFGPVGSRQSAGTQVDKSKRHTIHQTMTYYNLYFSERLDSSSGDSSKSPAAEQKLNDDVGNSTTSSETIRRTYNAESTTAALVGVHEGETSSPQKTQKASESRVESEVASLMQSSDSRTLCDNLHVSSRFQGGAKLDQMDSMRHFEDDDLQNNANSMQDDSTSMSFSVIAEFEEDDMLQYSSPTEPMIRLRQDSESSSRPVRQDKNDREEGEEGEEEQLQRYLYGADLERIRHHHQQQEHSSVVNQNDIDQDEQQVVIKNRLLPAQKSTSSGYDSIRSSNGVIAPLLIQSQPPSHSATDDYSQTTTSSSGAGSSLRTGSSPDQQAAGLTNGVTTTSGVESARRQVSATSESLANCTSCPSKSPPSSPPASARSQSVLTSLMSGPSRLRLFGRKRTKTRYWQLCMFVLGGKQEGGNHQGGGSNEQPITIWRLYI